MGIVEKKAIKDERKLQRQRMGAYNRDKVGDKKSFSESLMTRGVPRGDAQDARASPPPPLCIPPPGHVHPSLPSLKGWL